MSKTDKGPSKGERPGSYEYWSRRSELSGLRCPGRYTKTQTHRAERRQSKREEKDSD